MMGPYLTRAAIAQMTDAERAELEQWLGERERKRARSERIGCALLLLAAAIGALVGIAQMVLR